MLWPLLFGRPGKPEATRKMGRQAKLEGKHAELCLKRSHLSAKLRCRLLKCQAKTHAPHEAESVPDMKVKLFCRD